MGKFDRWEYSKQEVIFTEDERKEIWSVLKMASQGKMTEKDLKDYIEMLNRVIANHKK